MAEEQLSARQLARAVREKETKISFWARQGLLVFERVNGRTRVFPAAENIQRISYIKERQRQPQGCGLKEIRNDLNRNKHLVQRAKKSRED